MTPAAWVFLAALTVVGALSVWVGTWPTDVDGCEIDEARKETL